MAGIGRNHALLWGSNNLMVQHIMKNPKLEWLHSSGYVTHGSRCRISAINRIYLLLATLLHPFAPCMTATPLNFTAKVLGLLFAFLQLLKNAADGLRPQATQVQLQKFHKWMEIQLLTWSDTPGPWCCKFDGMKPCAGADPKNHKKPLSFPPILLGALMDWHLTSKQSQEESWRIEHTEWPLRIRQGLK